MRLLLVDGNASWVRSLFLAMPSDVELAMVRPVHPGLFRRVTGKSLWHAWGRGKLRQGAWDEYAVDMGWTRFPGLSTRILEQRCRQIIRRWGGISACDAIIFTLPQYCQLAERLHGTKRVYYAYDPYEFYDWDRAMTRANEDRMLAACEISAAISRKLMEDFRGRARGRLAYSPNAVSDSFLAAMREQGGHAARPADLAAIKGPIVGCTGTINSTYDWDLIDTLARNLPEATFVFVGNVEESKPAMQMRIEEVLSRPNVKWMGARPHKTLPSYLQAFDVCLNPLAVTRHNDRRSPLRLYDYLATQRPILSTGVAEAYEHGAYIEIGTDPQACVGLLRKMLSPGYRVDAAARSAYIAANTWSARALGFLRLLGANGETSAAVPSAHQEDRP